MESTYFTEFLKKIYIFSLSFILIGFIFYSIQIFAAESSYNLTDNDFTISVSDISPIYQSGEAQKVSGKWAFQVIIRNISDILLMSIPLFAGVAVIIAGYFYIFSGGDAERVSKGKTILKWNLVAILVAFLSFSLVNIIATFFS